MGESAVVPIDLFGMSSRSRLAALVEQLRSAPDALERDRIACRIERLNDPYAIPLLLRLRPDGDWGDEEWILVKSLILRFPGRVYAAQLGRIAPRFAKMSDSRFVDLLSVVIDRNLVEPFSKALPRLNGNERQLLLSKVDALNVQGDPTSVGARLNRLREAIRRAGYAVPPASTNVSQSEP